MPGLRYYELGPAWQRQPNMERWIVPGYMPPEAIPPTVYVMAPHNPSPPLDLDGEGAIAEADAFTRQFWLGLAVGGVAAWLLAAKR